MILCVCHAVSDRVVKKAIEEGACSMSAVRLATRAGSDCGSCRGAIHDLIERHKRQADCPPPEVGPLLRARTA